VELATAGEGAHDLYKTLIVAEASSGAENRTAAITVFGWSDPRLVMLDDVWVEIRPSGSIVLFNNLDQPGVLASVSGVLAAHGVNIADVALGRREGTGHALTVMRVDGSLDAATLADLAELNAVQGVRTLRFAEEEGSTMKDER
jgi:D-3-phosphoglycerate dehydrogenase / 2-oxoglutarate reductase